MERTLTLQDPPLRGPDVTSLQRLLSRKGFTVAVDGVYGPKTAAAVVRAKKALRYPKFRQLNFAGPLFRKLLSLYPDPAKIVLPKSFNPTHQTGGLPGFPAIDVFGASGTTIGAPENCTLVWPHLIPWNQTARVGGWTCYLWGKETGNTYFLTHFAHIVAKNEFSAGEVIGTIGAVPNGWWAPHIHEGLHQGHYDPPGV